MLIICIYSNWVSGLKQQTVNDVQVDNSVSLSKVTLILSMADVCCSGFLSWIHHKTKLFDKMFGKWTYQKFWKLNMEIAMHHGLSNVISSPRGWVDKCLVKNRFPIIDT